jgi:hypothetical protein
MYLNAISLESIEIKFELPIKNVNSFLYILCLIKMIHRSSTAAMAAAMAAAMV